MIGVQRMVHIVPRIRSGVNTKYLTLSSPLPRIMLFDINTPNTSAPIPSGLEVLSVLVRDKSAARDNCRLLGAESTKSHGIVCDSYAGAMHWVLGSMPGCRGGSTPCPDFGACVDRLPSDVVVSVFDCAREDWFVPERTGSRADDEASIAWTLVTSRLLIGDVGEATAGS